MNHYERLGIPRTATAKEIRAGWAKLVKELHADANATDATKEERIRDINAAYDVLKDPDKKAEYDRLGHFDGLFGGASFWEAIKRNDRTTRDRYEKRQYDFNDKRRAGAWTQEDPWGSIERDVHTRVELSFEESCLGGVQMFSITRRVKCKTCDGVGGTELIDCTYCDGKGEDRWNDKCDVCHGRGKMPDKLCKTCAGSGLASKEQKIRLTFPAGVREGEQLVLSNIGHETLDGKVGNCVVTLMVRPHEFFRRQDNHIYCVMKIDAIQAMLGGEVKIQTIRGEQTVKIRSGLQPGEMITLKDQGIHRGEKHGDQRVEVKVVVPELTAKQKAAFMEIFADKATAGAPSIELERLKEFMRRW